MSDRLRLILGYCGIPLAVCIALFFTQSHPAVAEEQTANGPSANPALSETSRHVAFESVATNLSDEAALSHPGHIFLRDRGPYCGNLTGDGQVTEDDLDILRFQSQYSQCPCCAADLTGDGKVGEDDHAIMNSLINDPPDCLSRDCRVPEE